MVAQPNFYLVDDTGTLTEIKDKAILNRIMEIEKLENQDKKPIIHVIDSAYDSGLCIFDECSDFFVSQKLLSLTNYAIGVSYGYDFH